MSSAATSSRFRLSTSNCASSRSGSVCGDILSSGTLGLRRLNQNRRRLYHVPFPAPDRRMPVVPQVDAPAADALVVDVLVVGGGPAGPTAATLLARKGHRVLLLEKASPPRFDRTSVVAGKSVYV